MQLQRYPARYDRQPCQDLHILWIAPTLTPRVLEYKDAFQTLVLDGLVRDGSLHIQRNALNVLNVVLSDVSVFEGKSEKFRGSKSNASKCCETSGPRCPGSIV